MPDSHWSKFVFSSIVAKLISLENSRKDLNFMTLQHKIKENARLSLKNYWGRAIGILAFLFGLSILLLLLEQIFCRILRLTADMSGRQFNISRELAVITAVFWGLGLLLAAPLSMGAKAWYCGQVKGERPPMLVLFSCFSSWKRLFRTVLFRLLVGIRKLLWGILFALPSLLIWFGLEYMPMPLSLEGVGPAVAAALAVLLLLTSILMAVLWYVTTLRYFLADYLFLAEEKAGLHRAIKDSVRAMKGRKRVLFRMQLSFLPWFLLGVFAAPLLFVCPYWMSSMAIFAQVRIEQLHRKEESEA